MKRKSSVVLDFAQIDSARIFPNPLFSPQGYNYPGDLYQQFPAPWDRDPSRYFVLVRKRVRKTVRKKVRQTVREDFPC